MSEQGKMAEEKMKKALETARRNFASVRTGRAAPSLLDRVVVSYYGSEVPLKQLASVSVPDPKMLVVQPYDKGSLSDIEKAIQKSDLGLNPSIEAGVVRLSIPPLTEERRKDLAKMIKKSAEDEKVVIRNIRRDILEHVKKQEKESHLSKDQVASIQEEIQKLTDRYTKEIDQLLASKEKEILEV